MQTGLVLALAGTAIAQAAGPGRILNFGGIPDSVDYPDVVSYQDWLTCSHATKTSSGASAPLGEEFAFSVRGPANIKQVAIYQIAGENTKRELADKKAARRSPKDRRHAHAKLHEAHKAKREANEKRAYGDVIVATYGPTGELMTFTDTWDLPSSALAIGGAAATPVANSPAAAAAQPTGSSKSSGKSSSSSGLSSAPSLKSNGQWGRVAYYNAEAGTAQGISFLNAHYSDPAYVKGDLSGHTDSPEVLADMQIPDDYELMITSDVDCDGDCGATNAGVTKKGWAGAKVALFEIQMPYSGSRATFVSDAPALWTLNSKIYNTAQYGCNCGNQGGINGMSLGGCGELDILEVVNNTAGTIDMGVASVHMGNAYAGTHPNYIARPASAPIKIAAIYGGGNAMVVHLDDDTDFPASLDPATVTAWTTGSSLTGGSFLQGAVKAATAAIVNTFDVTLKPLGA